MDTQEVQERFCAALEVFSKNEGDLLDRDVNERSLTHRLALYLEEEFKDWNVDCEYNRNGYEPKSIGIVPKKIFSDTTSGRTVYPDIIVHKRGSNDENLLIVEVKKSTGTEDTFEDDRIKIQAFRESDEYHYQVGCFVIMPRGGDEDGFRIEWS